MPQEVFISQFSVLGTVQNGEIQVEKAQIIYSLRPVSKNSFFSTWPGVVGGMALSDWLRVIYVPWGVPLVCYVCLFFAIWPYLS